MPKINRCTTQIAGGDFCDAEGMEDAPFPICVRHAGQVFSFMSQVVLNPIKYSHPDPKRNQDQSDPGVVYYVRMSDGHIKIGHSRGLKSRMRALYVEPQHVLAVEPGSDTTEAIRHREFAADRISDDRELFRPSTGLMAHIEEMAAKHAQERKIHLRRT